MLPSPAKPPLLCLMQARELPALEPYVRDFMPAAKRGKVRAGLGRAMFTGGGGGKGCAMRAWAEKAVQASMEGAALSARLAGSWQRAVAAWQGPDAARLRAYCGHAFARCSWLNRKRLLRPRLLLPPLEPSPIAPSRPAPLTWFVACTSYSPACRTVGLLAPRCLQPSPLAHRPTHLHGCTVFHAPSICCAWVQMQTCNPPAAPVLAGL